MKHYHQLALLICLLNFVFGFIAQSKIPLFNDEIDIGYQAWSLSSNLQDYRGNFLPTYISSLSESRAPLQMYFTLPFVAALGPQDLAVRLPVLILSSVTLYLFFVLIFYLTKQPTLSLLSSLFLFITPWFFHYGHLAFEVSLLLCLILASLLAYLYSRPLLHLLFICLALYTYNTAYIFLPLFLLFFYRQYPAPFRQLFRPLPIFLTLILLLPLGYHNLLGQGANRFGQISIFSSPEVINSIIERRTELQTDQANERLFHNKLISYIYAVYHNYSQSFSTQFLLLSGDPNPRHTPPSTSPLLPVFLITVILGLVRHLRHTSPSGRLFLYWLIISPLAASLTQGGGLHATRLIFMTIPLAYFSASGLLSLYSYHRPLSFLLALLMFLNFASFLHTYLSHYLFHSFQYFSYGYSELFSPHPSCQRHIISQNRFDKLLPFMFYQQVPPLSVQPLNDTPQLLESQRHGYSFASDRYLFITDWGDSDILRSAGNLASPGDCLYLFQQSDIPGDMDFSHTPLPGFTTLRTIYSPLHQPYAQLIQKI